MSNLIKPQLYPCQSAAALRSFSPLALLWFIYLLSYPPSPTPCSHPVLPLSLLFCFPPVMASGSTLTRPSARAQTNQSRVVLFHKDQKQLVSSHVSRFFLVYLCRPICLPRHADRECLPDFLIPLSMNYCLSACTCSSSSCCQGLTHLVSSMVAIKENPFDFCFELSVSGRHCLFLHDHPR